METSLAGLVSFLTMKNRLEMAFQGGRKGRGDCSPGIIYHPYCPRRLLDKHCAPPFYLRRLLDKHCTHPYYLRRLLAGLFSLPKRAKIAEKCPIF